MTKLASRPQVAPRIRGGYAVRFTALVGGLFLFSAGIVAFLESDLGLPPWDVLNQGLTEQTPLSFGAANVVISIVVLLIAWALGGPPGIGTAANAVLIGVFIELLLAWEAVAGLDESPLGVRIALVAIGLGLFGAGTAFYIGAALGAGPRDTLMLVSARRTGKRVGIVRACIEAVALLAGFLLGGTVGVGTLIFVLLIVPVVELSFGLLRRSPLAAPAPG